MAREIRVGDVVRCKDTLWTVKLLDDCTCTRKILHITDKKGRTTVAHYDNVELASLTEVLMYI